MVTKARLTAQDLWRLGEGDLRRELVNGEVIEMAPVGGLHGEITLRISRRLAEHGERQGGGKVLLGLVTRVVRVVAPQAKTATVYHAGGSARLLRESEALEGADILPGFTLPLAEVFR